MAKCSQAGRTASSCSQVEESNAKGLAELWVAKERPAEEVEELYATCVATCAAEAVIRGLNAGPGGPAPAAATEVYVVRMMGYTSEESSALRTALIAAEGVVACKPISLMGKTANFDLTTSGDAEALVKPPSRPRG